MEFLEVGGTPLFCVPSAETELELELREDIGLLSLLGTGLLALTLSLGVETATELREPDGLPFLVPLLIVRSSIDCIII